MKYIPSVQFSMFVTCSVPGEMCANKIGVRFYSIFQYQSKPDANKIGLCTDFKLTKVS